jgi:glycosyltransferase involved in cell wall biosynthesis
MQNKKMTVSVGIPAYNEEKNIGRLISLLLQQDQSDFILQEIFVVSDLSSDNTNNILLDFSQKNKVVKFFINKKRSGQAQTQNVILNQIQKSDAIVLLNADVGIFENNFLKKLIAPLREENVDLVCPQIVSQIPRNFFESVIQQGFQFKKDVFSKWKKGRSIYTCNGLARALSWKLAEQLRWPKIVAEDAYSYLWSITHGFQYNYAEEAVAFIRLPSNYIDHKNQSSRFLGNFSELLQYFPAEVVKKECSYPKTSLFTSLLKRFLSHPVKITLYVIIFLVIALRRNNSSLVAWEPAQSTKV